MLLTPRSTRSWLVTATSLLAVSALVFACGGEVGPADGDENASDATGGIANGSTGTSKSGAALPKGSGGMASKTGAAYSTAQGATGATIPGPGSWTTTVTVGQGGRAPREPGKVTAAGTPTTIGPIPAQGGSVTLTTLPAGPTCRNGVHDGDACNPKYDLTDCVVRTTRVCQCDSKQSVWQCRAYDANTGGTTSAGGQAAAAGSSPDAGGKHGSNDPVAGQSSVNLAGADGA